MAKKEKQAEAEVAEVAIPEVVDETVEAAAPVAASAPVKEAPKEPEVLPFEIRIIRRDDRLSSEKVYIYGRPVTILAGVPRETEGIQWFKDPSDPEKKRMQVLNWKRAKAPSRVPDLAAKGETREVEIAPCQQRLRGGIYDCYLLRDMEEVCLYTID